MIKKFLVIIITKKSFIFQTFMSMKNTLQKSTSDIGLTNLVEDFCVEFKKIIDKDRA